VTVSSGFKDKLYWRPAGGTFHCFKRTEGSPARCAPLCGRVEPLHSMGGQGIARPPPVFRCGRCDGLEMGRRGWDESGPERGDWGKLWREHLASANR